MLRNTFFNGQQNIASKWNAFTSGFGNGEIVVLLVQVFAIHLIMSRSLIHIVNIHSFYLMIEYRPSRLFSLTSGIYVIV